MKYARLISLVSLTGDYLILNAMFVAGFALTVAGVPHFTDKHLLFYIYLNAAWTALIFAFGATHTERNTSKRAILFAYVKIIVFYFFAFLMYFQAIPLQYYPKAQVKALFVLFTLALVAWKMLVYYGFAIYRQRGYNLHNVIILGYNHKAKELEQYIHNNKWHGYRLLGIFDSHAAKKKNIVGGWDDLLPFLAANDVREVFISWDCIPREQLHAIVDIISDFPVKVSLVPDLDIFSFKSVEIADYGMIPTIRINPGPLSMWYNRAIKRLFDILFSLIVLISVVSWVTLVVGALNLLQNRGRRGRAKGGIFFRQQRTCIDGKVFTLYKFRSMNPNPQSDTRQATRDDERVTRLGRFLRKWSIDELPQFYNVLRGDMSVVGPRPHMLRHTEEYQKLVKRFMLRHTVKPGLTGLAQVNGYRGEVREVRDIRKRFQYDVNYIEEWTFNMDIKIILLTVWVILRGQKEAY